MSTKRLTLPWTLNVGVAMVLSSPNYGLNDMLLTYMVISYMIIGGPIILQQDCFGAPRSLHCGCGRSRTASFRHRIAAARPFLSRGGGHCCTSSCSAYLARFHYRTHISPLVCHCCCLRRAYRMHIET